MKKKVRISAWIAVCLLLAAGLTAGWWGAAPASEAAVRPAQYEEEGPGFIGALDITIQSLDGKTYAPGELVLSDPFGEFAGYDPRNEYTYQDIPGSTYGWQPIPGEPELYAGVLHVRNAVSGLYSLRVIGTDYGRYRLVLDGYDRDMNRARTEFTALIEPGAIHHYLVNYSNRAGARLNVRRTRITY